MMEESELAMRRAGRTSAMSAAATKPENQRHEMVALLQPNLGTSHGEEKWSVLVLYEDHATRDRALALCDRLVKNFWSQVEFDFRWWRLDFLTDPDMAHTAAADARQADILIFSCRPQSDLCPVLYRWFEDWACHRETPEGMLLDLVEPEDLSRTTVQEKQARLRQLASLAHLDYFNRIPPPLGAPLFGSWQNVDARAHEVTSVLDNILRYVPPPSHFGLNE